MAIVRHAIEGLLLFVSAFYIGETLQSRGIAEGESKFWSCLFIVVVGGGIILLHRRWPTRRA